MNSNECTEKNYANALLQLQQSLNTYLESIEQLLVAIDKNHSLNKQNKKRAKKSISATISTLLEVQKIVYKKIQTLISFWDLDKEFEVAEFQYPGSNNFTEELKIAKLNKEIKNMEKYHLKKEPRFKEVIYYTNCQPSPPWKSPYLPKYKN